MSSTQHQLSPDAQATLLLCGHLEIRGRSAVAPLNLAEYRQVTRRLIDTGLRPADLLAPETLAQLYRDGAELPDSERMTQLLSQGGLLALQIEAWTNRGLWVLCRSDEGYPVRWKRRLQHASPPILYGVGNADLLGQSGLAILGVSQPDKSGLEFTRSVATRCAEDGINVISGIATGIESAALLSALEAGGNGAGILENNLARASVSRAYRQALRDRQLVLASPTAPHITKVAGGEAYRNQLIFSLAERVLLVGGEAVGVLEALEQDWGSVYLYREGGGNADRKLLDAGAIAIDGLDSDLLKIYPDNRL